MSLNQWIASAVAQKVGAVETAASVPVAAAWPSLAVAWAWRRAIKGGSWRTVIETDAGSCGPAHGS